MRVLALNSGSSSVKCALFEATVPTGSHGPPLRLERVASGSVSGIGTRVTAKYRGRGAVREEAQLALKSHEEAVRHLLRLVGETRIDAVGHRIVHGGHWFSEAVRIDAATVSRFAELADLAPLHNPACLAGIQEARAILGEELPMVAVFDTAFHHHLPEHARTYAIPRDLSARFQIRRYGFHGLAHGSSVALYADAVGKPISEVSVVTLHLGSGCSATAIRGGRSIDTSMGFTPLEGLVMGTRSGDIDPALVAFLADAMGLPSADIERILNEQSGLLGLSGLSADMALLADAARKGHPEARLAIDVFCYRARKYLGAYLAAVGGAEAVVFSGGIGEHAPGIRSRICSGMEWCGLILDETANDATTTIPAGAITRLSRSDARLSVFVAGIDEESAIAAETVSWLTR
jgi:acetate kinase